MKLTTNYTDETRIYTDLIRENPRSITVNS